MQSPEPIAHAPGFESFKHAFHLKMEKGTEQLQTAQPLWLSWCCWSPSHCPCSSLLYSCGTGSQPTTVSRSLSALSEGKLRWRLRGKKYLISKYEVDFSWLDPTAKITQEIRASLVTWTIMTAHVPKNLTRVPRGGGREAETSVSVLPDVCEQHLAARCAYPPLEII